MNNKLLNSWLRKNEISQKALKSVAFARWNDDGIIHCDRECWKVIWLLKVDREAKLNKQVKGSRHCSWFPLHYVNFIMSLKNPREKKGYKVGIYFCLGDIMKSRITSEEIIKIKGQE